MKSIFHKDSVIEFTENVLENNHKISNKLKGNSMFPTLRAGDKGLFEKCYPDNLHVGDILLWEQSGELIAHRLISIVNQDNNWEIITRGDNNSINDKKFTENELIGKLVAFERNGRVIAIDSFRMRLAKFRDLNFHKTNLLCNRMKLFVNKLFPFLIFQYRSIITNIRSLLQGVEKQFRTNAIISVLKGLVPLAMIVSIKFLIDFISRNSLQTPEQKYLFFGLLAITALLFMASGLLNQIGNYFSEKMSQSVSRKVYAQLHQKHIRLHLTDFENSDKLDKMHRAVQEASYRPMRILSSALGFIKTVSAGILLIALFVSIRWYLLLILLVAVLPETAFRVLYVRRLHRMKEAQMTTEREKFYYNRVVTGFPFAKEMRLFAFSNYFIRRFNIKQDELFAEKLALTKYDTRNSMLAQAFGVLLIFASLGIVSYLSIGGMMSIGTVVLFFFAFQRGYGILNEFFRSITGLIEDNTFLEDYLAFLRLPDAETDKVQTPEPFRLKESLKFENLSFRYESSERLALKNINITVPAGKTVALVGENGAGKTTLIKLLCGFYKPISGKITIDNVDARKIGQENILENVTAVFQDFALYQVAAVDNIMLGDYGKPRDLERARQSAQIAGIDEALSKMPKGYDTRLGHLFKESEELSIGQWQKMALARAFYRDAPLLLMDEPSSALDANSERQIVNTLKKLSENKTTLIVSHRLSTVQWADYIYLLDEGEVAEEGTHDKLMALEGKYYTLFQALKS